MIRQYLPAKTSHQLPGQTTAKPRTQIHLQSRLMIRQVIVISILMYCAAHILLAVASVLQAIGSLMLWLSYCAYFCMLVICAAMMEAWKHYMEQRQETGEKSGEKQEAEEHGIAGVERTETQEM